MTYKERYNKTKEFVSSYWKVISLTPLILGGIWQLMILANIDISYIRFFSISQQISDGLAFSAIIASIACSLGIVYLIFTASSADATFTDLINIKSRYLIMRAILNIIMIFGPYKIIKYYTGYDLLIYSDKGFFQDFGLAQFNYYILIIGFIISYVYRAIENIVALFQRKWKLLTKFLQYLKNSEIALILITFFPTIISLIIMIFFLLIIIPRFNHRYSNPEKSVNISYFLSKYNKSKDKTKRPPKILYFNDKYIFIQVSEKDSVEVVSIENMIKKYE